MGVIGLFIWFTQLNAKFENSRATCQATSECVLKRIGVCGKVQAVHVSQIDLAEAYTRNKKLANPLIQCSPELPIEEFESLCLNQKCQVMTKNQHLFLEVRSQPVAGKPFLVGMGFRFERNGELEAQFHFPQGVRIAKGQATWSGPVEAMKEYAVWVEMLADTPGTIYLSGWARMKASNQEMSPLSWGDYFTVMPEGSFGPHPTGERVLATPTAQP